MSLRFKNEKEFTKWLESAGKNSIRDITPSAHKEDTPKVEDTQDPNIKYSSDLTWILGFLVGLIFILLGILLPV